MKRTAIALALAAMTFGPALAQTGTNSGSTERAPVAQEKRATTDGATIVRVDVARVALGHRASKLVGATVVNSADESIGKIDDLVVNPQDKVTYAIVSVGGFLGVGNKLVAVPFTALQPIKDERLMLSGATKEALKGLPEFKYAKS
jgi:sporulation protein YlmC with PRC-barrel domain